MTTSRCRVPISLSSSQQPAHHHSLSTATTPLVGREKEQEVLRECLKDVLSKSKSSGGSSSATNTVFVHGKSGVGKTALIESCLQEWDGAECNAIIYNTSTSSGSAHDNHSFHSSSAASSFSRRVWVARGKHEQFQDEHAQQPYSAILKALDGLGQQIQKVIESTAVVNPPARVESADQHLERHMHMALQFEGHILSKMVPSLTTYGEDQQQNWNDAGSSGAESDHAENILDMTTEDDSMQVTLAAERLAVALLTFLNHFCTSIGPLVLFLDDVQWSDAQSQQLLSTIIGDNKTNGSGLHSIDNFLLVVGHRDKDENGDSSNSISREQQDAKTSSILQAQWNKQSSTICNIPVQDLSVEQVEEMLRVILRVVEGDGDDITDSSNDSRRDIKGLASVIFRKTLGNPYYVMQQLEYLHSAQESILQYNFATANWEWDLEQVRLYGDSSENVVHVVTSRVTRVPMRVKRLLQLASCLGYFVEMNILELLEKHVARLREMSPLWEMVQEGIDLKEIQWSQDAGHHHH